MRKLAKQIWPLLFLALLIAFPTVAISGAKDGLILWYSTIVPTLLPFIIISNLILKSGSTKYFTLICYPIYKRYPKLNPNLPYALMLGFFCGYPMGGKIINDLVAARQLTKAQGQFLLYICNNASPMFMIGYVMVATLKSQINYMTLLFFIYTPIILFSVIYLFFHKGLLFCQPDVVMDTHPASDSSSFDDTMIHAFFIVMKIGGYIMIFSIISYVFLYLDFDMLPLSIGVIGLSEITTGIKYLGDLTLPFSQKIALITAATAFGGFSSVAQTKSVLSESKLSIRKYVVVKLLLCCMTYVLVTLYYSI